MDRETEKALAKKAAKILLKLIEENRRGSRLLGSMDATTIWEAQRVLGRVSK